jgi:hypothetical protein
MPDRRDPAAIMAIRKRDAEYGATLPPRQIRGVAGVMQQMVSDRRTLLGELDRLVAALAEAREQFNAELNRVEHDRDEAIAENAALRAAATGSADA